MKEEELTIKRRQLLKLGTASAFGLVVTAGDLFWQVERARGGELTPVTPDAALQKLMAGNQRFTAHKAQHPHQSAKTLQDLAQAQHPFATVLSCADSRVTAEIIFDQGLGDIFDVRIAGNLATQGAVASIEYAVVELKTPILMVLGHERCGAVTAAVKKADLPGEMGLFVKEIAPAVKKTQKLDGDAVDNAVVANVKEQMEKLKRSPLLAERLASGQLKIVGGRYDLDTGKVTAIA
jgi:carbonic anhydrase